MPGYGKKMMYGTGGSKKYGKGGSLKPVPSDNKGLPKLSKTVRNNMGYMGMGGPTMDPMYMHGGSVTKFERNSTRKGRCM